MELPFFLSAGVLVVAIAHVWSERRPGAAGRCSSPGLFIWGTYDSSGGSSFQATYLSILFPFKICKTSCFFIENGWGGRVIDPNTWKPIETFEGPSFWGHERLYLPGEERMKFRNKRLETASEGKQAPLFIDCPWLYSNTINKK